MKKLLLTSCCLVLFPMSAQAETTTAACQILEKHTPADNVVHKGNADMNEASNIVPEIIKVPLDVNLAKRVAGLTGTGVEMDASLGMMEIHSDGKVTYNGEDWTAPMMILCGQSHVIKEAIEIEAPVVEKPMEATPIINNEPIINRTNILNTTPILNRKPAGDRAGEVSKEVDAVTGELETSATGRTVGTVSKATDDAIKVMPIIAVPPSNIIPEPTAPITRGTREDERTIKEPSDLIEGGEYKDIYYNE